MTEEEWLACSDPIPLVVFLLASGRASDRKLRLLGAACCRRVLPFLDGPLAELAERAVQLGENVADTGCGKDELAVTLKGLQARGVAATPLTEGRYQVIAGILMTAFVQPDRIVVRMGLNALANAAGWNAAPMAVVDVDDWASPHDPVWRAQHATEQAAQADLVRDLFDNAVRPVTEDPSWRTGGVVDLARMIYEDRTFDVMPALGVALSDAGCKDPMLLRHCGAPGPHVRGCFALDLLLGKE